MTDTEIVLPPKNKLRPGGILHGGQETITEVSDESLEEEP